jgi:hypothetical protein
MSSKSILNHIHRSFLGDLASIAISQPKYEPVDSYYEWTVLKYLSNGVIYFNRGNLVYRSVKRFENVPIEGMLSGIHYEWKLFGLPPENQPHLGFSVMDEIKRMVHPRDYVFDVDATIALLRFRLSKKMIGEYEPR